MRPFKSNGMSFNEIPLNDPKKSSFDISSTNKGSGKIGALIPVLSEELMPGDRFRLNTKSLLRFEPLAVPVLSNMQLRSHSYVVPFRQLWTNWEEFITGGRSQVSNLNIPFVTLSSAITTLAHHYNALCTDIGESSQTLPFSGASNFFLDPFGLRASLLSAEDAVITAICNNFYSASGVSPTSPPPIATVYNRMFAGMSSSISSEGIFMRYLNSIVANLYKLFGYSGGTLGTVDIYESIDVYRYRVKDKLDNISEIISSLWNVRTSVSYATFFEGVRDIYRLWYEAFLEPFLGAGSVWDYLCYPCILWSDLYSGPDSFQGIVFSATASARKSQLTDLLSVPVSVFDNLARLSVLPLRAFYRVWWYNYRDQNLELLATDPKDIMTDNGSDYLYLMLAPRNVAWSKDTFTTATLNAYNTNAVVPITNDTEELSTVPVQVNSDMETGEIKQIQLPRNFVQGNTTPVTAISGLSLSNLRKVEALARWLDKNMFIGYEYADQLFSHYGVRYSDARMQIPEFIGGNVSRVEYDVITNNTSTSEQVAGDQISRAGAYLNSPVSDQFVEEHGMLLTIISVLPEQTYTDGVPRSLLMQNKFDLAFPEFAQLGSDIVQTNEIWFNKKPSTSGQSFTSFGYQGRYYHYKTGTQFQHGELKTTRKEYTFARYFESAPKLSPEFIHCCPYLGMFVSPYSDHFIYDVLLDLKVSRALPVYDKVL